MQVPTSPCWAAWHVVTADLQNCIAQGTLCVGLDGVSLLLTQKLVVNFIDSDRDDAVAGSKDHTAGPKPALRVSSLSKLSHPSLRRCRSLYSSIPSSYSFFVW